MLRRGGPVNGYLKIGANHPKKSKGKGAPFKFDHIEITTRSRDDDGNLIPNNKAMTEVLKDETIPTCGGCARSKKLGFPKGLPRRVGILITRNALDLAFPNRHAWYKGKTLVCRGDGDGSIAMRRAPGPPKTVGGKKIKTWGDFAHHEPCGHECEQFQSRECKLNGKLRCQVAVDVKVGGSIEFRTTSWGSVSNIQDSLEMISEMTGGWIAWIPLWFEIVEEQVNPKDGGAPQKAWIAQVSSAVKGGPNELLAAAQEILKVRGGMVDSQLQLEAKVDRKTVWVEEPEEIEAVVREFYTDTDDALQGAEPAGAPDGPSVPAQPSTAGAAIGPTPAEGCVSSEEPSTEFDEKASEITGGQFGLLKAKCETRSLELGIAEEDWSTIFGHVLKAMGVQSAAELSVPDGMNDALAKISAYELPGDSAAEAFD
jgi:hypothetical protein